MAVLNVDLEAHFFVYEDRDSSVHLAVQSAPCGVGSLAVGSSLGGAGGEEGGETMEPDVRVSLGMGVEVSLARAVAAKMARARSLILFGLVSMCFGYV